jgi:hypothetical protein
MADRISKVLSREQHDKYERDGYLIFDPGIPDDRLDATLAETKPLFDEKTQESFTPGARVKDAWTTSAAVRGLALAPTVLAAIEELYGRPPVPFQTLNFPYGTQQGVHSDAAHFQSDPAGFMCAVWIALEEMDADNGPLIYYPGSHRLPPPTWDRIKEETGLEPDWTLEPEQHVADKHEKFDQYNRHLIEKHGLEPAYGTIQKGQALLWASNLLHGGSAQRDKSRTRHSQVTHYLFDRRPYVQPMWDQPGGQRWNYPEWVRDPPPVYTPEVLRDAIASTAPPGSTVLVVSDEEAAADLDDRRALPFPPPKGGSSEEQEGAIGRLEKLREEGAEFIVFPKNELLPLKSSWSGLQNHLERNYRAAHCDGSICVVYALRG